MLPTLPTLLALASLLRVGRARGGERCDREAGEAAGRGRGLSLRWLGGERGQTSLKTPATLGGVGPPPPGET